MADKPMTTMATPKEVEMTAPPEAVSVGPDYSSIASSMALVRKEEEAIHCVTILGGAATCCLGFGLCSPCLLGQRGSCSTAQ